MIMIHQQCNTLSIPQTLWDQSGHCWGFSSWIGCFAGEGCIGVFKRHIGDAQGGHIVLVGNLIPWTLRNDLFVCKPLNLRLRQTLHFTCELSRLCYLYWGVWQWFGDSWSFYHYSDIGGRGSYAMLVTQLDCEFTNIFGWDIVNCKPYGLINVLNSRQAIKKKEFLLFKYFYTGNNSKIR